MGSNSIMDVTPNENKVLLPNLLLKLHNDGLTGVVTVKDNRRTLKIYLKDGHVVYADGIDKDAQLLKEIASKKKLAPGQLEELQAIKQRDPQSLGKTLIEKNIISAAVWAKFLHLKVKAVLISSLDMENAELGFSQSALGIPPVNFIDHNIVQLLLDSIRGIQDPERIGKRVSGEEAVFALSGEAESLGPAIPLSPSEQAVFSEVDGRKSLRDLAEATGLPLEGVLRGIYLLACFGLILELRTKAGGEAGETDYDEIISLNLDLLGIIGTNFQKEVGREFDNIFSRCKSDLTGDSKTLFHDLTLEKDAQEAVAVTILERFSGRAVTAEGRLVLLSSFNKLLYLLIMRMKKVLGKGLAENTLKEMMNILEYVEKYRQDTELMNYVRGNLQDYLHQIQS